MKEETRLTRAGRPHDGGGLVNAPVERASTLLAPDSKALYDRPQGRARYARGGTATQDALRDALCGMTGADYCALAPSGLSAVILPLLAAARAGGRVLAADCIYGPVRRFLDEALPNQGAKAEFFDPRIGAGVEALLGEDVNAVLLESPGSLTFELQDIPAIARAAAARNIPVICDDTWSAGILMKPLALGADCAAQSLSKYVSGHSDVLIGAALARGPFAERLKETEYLFGLHASPDDAFLALRGLRTLPLRIARSGEAALAIARWLEGRAEVARVLHPALPGHPDHALFRRDFTAPCGVFGVIFKGWDRARADAFIDALALFGIGFSWGGYESLAINCDPQIKRSAVPWKADGALIRFAIGLEHPDDLIADIERALGE